MPIAFPVRFPGGRFPITRNARHPCAPHQKNWAYSHDSLPHIPLRHAGQRCTPAHVRTIENPGNQNTSSVFSNGTGLLRVSDLPDTAATSRHARLAATDTKGRITGTYRSRSSPARGEGRLVSATSRRIRRQHDGHPPT